MIIRTSSGEILRCPLSQSEDLVLLRQTTAAEIATVYKMTLNLDIAGEFAGVDGVYLLQSLVSDLIFFYPAVTGSDSFYKQLGTLPWYYQREKFEFARAESLIPQGARVLEVGCGHGFFGERPHMRETRYTGLEFSQEAVRQATARNLQVLPVTAEEHAKTHAGAYDVVCSFQVFEHVSDPGSLLRACCELLAPGGQLIISMPGANSFMSYTINEPLSLPPHHVTWWTDKCLSWIPAAYPLRLSGLVHQNLSQGGHRGFYLKHFVDRALLKYMGETNIGLINLSPTYHRMQPISQLLTQVLALGFEHSDMEPRGHTVIANYVKT
jgi:SAM-dependent methyltransferase